MQMKIIVETEEEYNAWLQEQKIFKNSLVQN
jgi:cytochrome c oxidase subunit 2